AHRHGPGLALPGRDPGGDPVRADGELGRDDAEREAALGVLAAHDANLLAVDGERDLLNALAGDEDGEGLGVAGRARAGRAEHLDAASGTGVAGIAGARGRAAAARAAAGAAAVAAAVAA